MSNETAHEWLPLAQHGHWLVEYRPDSRIVRLRMEGATMYFEREAYQLLWGMVSSGLDELERMEDESGRRAGMERGAESRVVWPQTRH